MSTQLVLIINENGKKYNLTIPKTKKEMGLADDSHNLKIKFENPNTGNMQQSHQHANNKQARPKYTFDKDEFDDDSDNSYISEDSAFEDQELEVSSEAQDINIDLNCDFNKSSRRNIESTLNLSYDPLDKRKRKKVLQDMTEEEVNRKNDILLQRKAQLKMQQEEEKRMAIEKILNDEGKKLKDKQKRQNELKIKKERDNEEKQKQLLTKLRIKYSRDNRVYVRFPSGLLIPKILNQPAKPQIEEENILHKQCQVQNCLNKKRYRDPATKTYFCSVDCFRKLKGH